jgi:hypothetical protein
MPEEIIHADIYELIKEAVKDGLSIVSQTEVAGENIPQY